MKIRLGRFQFDYDKDYGIDLRSGWSAAVGGSYRVQFVSFPRAVLALFS